MYWVMELMREAAKIMRFQPEHLTLTAQVLITIGWEQRYIDGQLAAVKAFAEDDNAAVFVGYLDDGFSGYLSVQFYQWNRLGQIHGLVVDPSARRRGVAAGLVRHAEEFVHAKGGRGVYVDTPVTNTGARDFYVKQGFKQDYIMTAYYDTDLDGVTYLKLFDRA